MTDVPWPSLNSLMPEIAPSTLTVTPQDAARTPLTPANASLTVSTDEKSGPNVAETVVWNSAKAASSSAMTDRSSAIEALASPACANSSERSCFLSSQLRAAWFASSAASSCVTWSVDCLTWSCSVVTWYCRPSISDCRATVLLLITIVGGGTLSKL